LEEVGFCAGGSGGALAKPVNCGHVVIEQGMRGASEVGVHGEDFLVGNGTQ